MIHAGSPEAIHFDELLGLLRWSSPQSQQHPLETPSLSWRRPALTSATIWPAWLKKGFVVVHFPLVGESWQLCCAHQALGFSAQSDDRPRLNVREWQVPHINARRKDIVSRERFGCLAAARAARMTAQSPALISSVVTLSSLALTWEGVSRSFLVKGNSPLRQTQYGTFAETPSHPPMNNRKQLISSWSVPVICDEPQTPEWRIAGPEKEQKTAHARSKRQTWETRKPQSHLKTVSEDSCAIVVCADKTIIRQRMKWQKHYSLWQNIFSFHLGWTFRSLKVWLPAMFSYVYWPSFQLNVTLVMCHSVIALQRVKVYFFDHHFFSTQGAAVGVKATAAVLLLLILAIQWNLSHELSHYSLSVRFYCVLSNSCDFLS